MQGTKHLLLVGVGGLGKAIVNEALERGLKVSVVVRNRDKFEKEIGGDTLQRLARVIVGDGTDAKILDDAFAGVDVVLSGQGARVELAEALAAGVKRNAHVSKLIWPAGATNVLAEDGKTPNWVNYQHMGAWVQQAFKSHGACIEAIRKADINFVIFCPGYMKSVGKRSPVETVRASIRVNRDGGSFISYEDAAWVNVEAAIVSTWDKQLIGAGTKQ